MGVKRPWLTWVLLGGLVAVFAGARVFGSIETLRMGVVAAGAVAVAAAAALRIVAWRQAEGEARSMEAILALCCAGCTVALAGFALATDFGVSLAGLEFDEAMGERRFKRFFLVASTILLSFSLLPALAAQWALAKGGRAGELQVDALRVRQSSASALSVALAGAALIFIGYMASAFDRTADFSFFKTATPGESVREIVLGMDGPLRAALFFPDVHPVKDEALVYLNELARVTGKVVIEEYDRFDDPAAAEEFQARSDGVLYLRRGEAQERIFLGMDLEEARPGLRVLDSQVQAALLQLGRERRKAYLTIGHGELNDPLAAEYPGETGLVPDPGQFDTGLLPLQALRALMGLLNYDVYELGGGDGLANKVPDDADMLMILGPRRPFLEDEMNAVRDYLDRGGALVLALEPGGEFALGGLREDLGVDYEPAMVMDDEWTLSTDRRGLVTNQFSMHPAVTTPSRQSLSNSVVMLGPGSFTPLGDREGVKTESIVESPLSSFADLNGNFTFDEGVEEKRNYFLAVAVERTDGGAGPGEEASAGMRALVYADAEIFSDRWIGAMLNPYLVRDGILWLHGEEAFAGEVVSEEDIPVLHTRAENVFWFYTIIFGAPAAVLGLGLAIVYRQRRQGREAGGEGS